MIGGSSKYEKAVEALEKRSMWWEEAIEGLELHQLEEFLAGLEGLIGNVNKRVEESYLRSEEEKEFDMSAPPPLQHLFAGDSSSPIINF